MTLRVHPDEIVASDGSPLLAIAPQWNRVRLGEVAQVTNGYPFPSAQFGSSGDIPIIRIRDVGKTSSDTWLSGHFEPEYVVQPGTLLVGMDGDFRAAMWTGPPALLNQRVCKIEIRRPEVYSIQFLSYVLPGYLNAVHRATSAVTVKHLSSETLKALPLPCPPRAEQDSLVDAIEEQLSRVEAGMASLHNAQRRLACLPRRISDQLLKVVEEQGWPVVELGEVLATARYGTSTKCLPSGTGLPVVRIPNVQSGSLELQELKYAVDPALDLSSTMLSEDDVLIIRTNGSLSLIGRAAVVPRLDMPVSFASYLIRLQVDVERIRPRYLLACLESSDGRRQIERMAATSAGQYNLNLAKIRQCRIPLPDGDVQAQVVQSLRAAGEEIERLGGVVKAVSDRARVLRSAVLAAAFSGRLTDQLAGIDVNSDDPLEQPEALIV